MLLNYLYVNSLCAAGLKYPLLALRYALVHFTYTVYRTTLRSATRRLQATEVVLKLLAPILMGSSLPLTLPYQVTATRMSALDLLRIVVPPARKRSGVTELQTAAAQVSGQAEVVQLKS